MRTLGALLLLALVTLAAPRSVEANPITLVGVGDPTVRASVLMVYTGLTSTTGTLALTISNISTAYNPALTGFAFNAPTNVTGVSGSAPSGWSYSYSPNNINSPGNYGFFDISGLTGPNFNGGKPNKGIQINTSATFTFNLTGSNMNLLTAASFLTLNSVPSNQNSSVQPFIARFQRTGANGQGSQVALPVTTQVPEPTSLSLLGGLGLATLLGLRRRRAKQ